MPNRMQVTSSGRSGFTLTELLVAIGLVAVLMLAVNTIFKTTADTIGAGQAISAGMRDMRAVQSVIKRDLDGAAMADGPFFMIRSSVQVGFLNQKDQLTTVGYSATGMPADVNAIMTADLGNGLGPQLQATTNYGVRTFRQDTLGFFSRGTFQRQTGTNAFAAPMTSNEAYIWYGHLMLPNNAGTYRCPGLWDPTTGVYTTANGVGGTAANDNNFYANQWILGRNAILLRNASGGVISDDSGAAQFYYTASAGAVVADVPPLADNQASASAKTRAYDGTSYDATVRVFDSRYDLAGTTIANYRTLLAQAIAGGATWSDWAHFGYRVQADPFPSRPLDPAKAARTTPIFVPNCSQFVVEYAGDFTTQAPGGGFMSNTPDGTVDFIVDPVTSARRIRWYGLPRSTTGNVTVNLANGDVVPLRDFCGAPQTFERVVPTLRVNYADTAGSGLAPGDSYVCAWGPDCPGLPRPSMIRILIKQEDPSGRTDLPWQEMVFNLAQ